MNINHTKMVLEINSCKNYEVLEVRQGDKKSRIIDFTFTVNGEIITLTSTMTAKVNATVDNVIVAEDVAAAVDTENNVVTVTLADTMLALSGLCKMDIVLTEGDEIITAETICLRIGKKVINDDSKPYEGAGTIADLAKEIEAARGTQPNLNERFVANETNLENKANTADVETVKSEITSARGEYDNLGQRLDTLIDGNEQGQVDTFNLAEGAVTAEIIADRAITLSKLSTELLAMLNTINNKADKATTLAGYGITDAYTKDEVQKKLNKKLDSMPFDSEPTLNSPCYLTSGTVYNALQTKADVTSVYSKTETDNSLGEKSAKTKAKLDLPDELFIVKGGTLELFKYGMYYTDTEFLENQYNVRVVNINSYVTSYDDKILISCPSDYSKPILQGDYDLALFQLIDTYGKVIEQKRVKIFVVDKSKISDSDRNIAYLGDSFTGMGYRTQEIANLISKESNLSKTKLIGKFSGQGAGNKFTGTGGYSWANYAENPNTLPSAYPNNYLWDPDNNHISTKYLVDSLGENHLEYVVILLGWNDYESGAFGSSFSWDVMKQRAKCVIENIHNYYPNCKIILESYHYMYPLHRKSYGSSLPQVRQNKYIYDLNRFYQVIANEYDYVKFVQMSIQIDVLHNMGFIEEKVNKRNDEIVKYCKDVVHPANIGFYQYSDAEFAALLYLMQ